MFLEKVQNSIKEANSNNLEANSNDKKVNSNNKVNSNAEVSLNNKLNSNTVNSNDKEVKSHKEHISNNKDQNSSKREKNNQNSMILMKESRSKKFKKSEMLSVKDNGQSATKIVIPNCTSFSSCYIELCKRRRLRPLPVICVTLPYSLDFTTDRVKMDDWNPILNALSLDHSLKSIAIRSRFQYRKPLENVTSEVKARSIGNAPVVLTRYLLEWLSHSVSQCVRNSSVLTSLELEGIPLPPDCLAVLCVGLSSTSCLRHLSLFKCYIGDVSCEMICRTIADINSIRTLNLGQCDLSSRCASALATALSRQKLLLFHDTWKESLRYREPNLDSMPGLRRLTLNGNPRLGDLGVNEILEAIVDSLWLKALDLQQCGLTDVITNEIMDLLDYNETLVVVDVRMNNNLQDELAQKIAAKLEQNNAAGKSEYKWFSLPKKKLTKSMKRIDHQEDLHASKAKNKRIKDNCPLVLPKSAPCKIAPSETVKAKQTSSRSIKLVKSQSTSDTKQLVLDLKAQMESANGSFSNLMEEGKGEKEEEILEEMERNTKDSKIQIDIQEILMKENKSTEKDLDEIRQQLEKTRREHELLLERTKQNEISLIKERIRRETTETKLRFLKNNLMELENALKEKEQETRGFLLVSQSSLDEICTSFDNLLDMLESGSRNRNVILPSEDESILRDDIRSKMALLIRKTKSESFRRGYYTEEVSKEMKSFVRSEADMRSLLPLLDMIHFEKKIGDSPDLVTSAVEDSVYKPDDRFWIKDSFIGDNIREEQDVFQKKEDGFMRSDSYLRDDDFLLREDGYHKIENGFSIGKDGFSKKEDGFLRKEDGFMKREDGFLKRDDVFLKRDEVFLERDDVFLERKDVFLERKDGFLEREDGLLKREDGFSIREDGYIKMEEGFVKREGIFINKEDGLSRKESFRKRDKYFGQREKRSRTSKDGFVKKNKLQEFSSQSKDDSSQSRDESFHSKEDSFHGRDVSFQSGEDSFHSRENSFQSREESFQSREESFHSREESFHSREESFQSSEDSFQSREDSSRNREGNSRDREDRFQLKDTGLQIKEVGCPNIEDNLRNIEDSLRNRKDSFQNTEEDYEREEDNLRKIIENLRKGKEKKIEFNNFPASPLTKERARAIFIQIVNGNMLLNLNSQ